MEKYLSVFHSFHRFFICFDRSLSLRRLWKTRRMTRSRPIHRGRTVGAASSPPRPPRRHLLTVPRFQLNHMACGQCVTVIVLQHNGVSVKSVHFRNSPESRKIGPYLLSTVTQEAIFLALSFVNMIGELWLNVWHISFVFCGMYLVFPGGLKCLRNAAGGAACCWGHGSWLGAPSRGSQ